MKMIRNLVLGAATALSMSTGAALAAGGAGYVEDIAFSFEGPFGSYDRNQLQRGLQVYTEVCAACHGLKFVPLRTLADPGGPALPADQVRAYAAQFEIFDPELDDFRPRKATDHFPGSGLENAPDLSLITKSRAGFSGPYGLGINQLFRGIGGAEYAFSVLTGYDGEEKEEAGTTFYGNRAFPGGWIAMSAPLYDGAVEYADGTEASTRQMAEDVSAFLTWAAEPKMMARKQTGFTAVMFLVILSALLYLTNKRLWAGVKGRKAA
jgi:ubiquinol-cytochrome c reductase cytochrome c1 subunit